MESQTFTSAVEDDDIAQSTVYVLGCLGSFFVAISLYYVLKLSRKVSPARHHVEQPPGRVQKSNVVPTRKTEAPKVAPQSKKPGVSLKQLVKNSQQTASRQTAIDKPVEHPLYLNALKGFHGNVVGLSISTDGQIATVTDDQVLKVFDARDLTAKTVPSLRHAMSRLPVDVAFAGQHDMFVLTEGPLGNCTMELMRLEAGLFTQMWTVSAVHGKEAGKGILAAVNQHGQGLAISYTGQTDVQVFDTKKTKLASVDTSGLQNHSAAFSRQGRFFGAATFTSDVKLHEIQFTREGELRKVQKVMDLKYAHKGQVYCLDFSPDGKRAVTASKDGTWVVWNIDVRFGMDEDPKILVQRPQETGDARYTHVAFGAHGVIAAAFNQTIHVLDAHRGTLLEVIEEAHDGRIINLECSPVQHTVGKAKVCVFVSSALDKRVRLWRAPLL